MWSSAVFSSGRWMQLLQCINCTLVYMVLPSTTSQEQAGQPGQTLGLEVPQGVRRAHCGRSLTPSRPCSGMSVTLPLQPLAFPRPTAWATWWPSVRSAEAEAGSVGAATTELVARHMKAVVVSGLLFITMNNSRPGRCEAASFCCATATLQAALCCSSITLHVGIQAHLKRLCGHKGSLLEMVPGLPRSGLSSSPSFCPSFALQCGPIECGLGQCCPFWHTQAETTSGQEAELRRGVVLGRRRLPMKSGLCGEGTVYASGAGPRASLHVAPLGCSLLALLSARPGDVQGRAVGLGCGDDGAAPQALPVLALGPQSERATSSLLLRTEVHGDGGEYFAEDAEPYGMGPKKKGR